jgi:hypothetical protein
MASEMPFFMRGTSLVFNSSTPAKGEFVQRKRNKSGPETGATAKVLGVLGLLTASSALLFSLLSGYFLPRQKPENPPPAAPAEQPIALGLPFFLQANPGQQEQRPLFPLSVIPRGVASAQELHTALARDPVAAAHYAGFSVAASRLVRVQKDRAVYVSYRSGNRIYWTRNRMWLRRGEMLVSDGRSSARARCGNRISEVAALPVAAEDPPEKILDQAYSPVDLPFDAYLQDFSPVLFAAGAEPPAPGPSSPPAPGSGIEVPPIGPIFCCAGGGSNLPPGPPVLPPVSIPEPETWLLLISGAAFYFLFRRK